MKKKLEIGVSNKLKGSYGETIITKGKPTVIKVNVKKHKGDRAELADTIQHELRHARHPKMSEKAVQKSMPKVISPSEQAKLIARLKGKKINYTKGAAKRKLGIDRHQKLAPGDLIRQSKPMTSRERLAVLGMV